MKSFLVNFSGHCFMTIKLERRTKKKKTARKRFPKCCAESINWINKSIFDSCNIESHFYSHEERSHENSCIKIVHQDTIFSVHTIWHFENALSFTVSLIDHFDTNRLCIGHYEVRVE